MALLAETYPVSLSPLAWELYPKCKVSFQSVPNERNIRPIGPTRKLFFDDDISLYPGPLRVVLSLLTSSWITLDLQAHQEILKVRSAFDFFQVCEVARFAAQIVFY